MNLLFEAPPRQRGAALVIVLAFVVLLTGVAVAYLSRTTSDRQVAHSSSNQSSADQLAQSAVDNIIGDLRQEITNGSGSPSPTASPVTLFVPTSNANMVSMRNPTPTPGTTPAIPNLIRRSVHSDPALWPDPNVGPALRSRASAVNSTSDVSANGRSVSLGRWNSHYLIPKRDTGTGDSIPIDAFADVTPDWVFVAPDPNNQGQEWRKVINTPDQTVVGRYAYAIYDEGGLLDMNAAGYPSPTTILQYGRKGSLAFADLTALGGFSTTSTDNVVGWRNYASARPTGNLNPPSANISFSTNSTNTYYNFILSDPNFIKLTNYFTGTPLTYFTNSFLRTSQTPVFNSQTDQALTARQELIKLRSAVVGSGISFTNALQSLGTFSREALANVPQWSPVTPDAVNPNFQTLFVTQQFTRNDGTTANVGEYLVNRRFLLQRLNWLTYKGPSATVANGGTRNPVPTSAPAIGDPDYDLWLLTRGTDVRDINSIRFGLTSAFLQQGTAANILKYFGLVWQDATNQPDPTQRERWNYVGHSGGNSPASSIVTLGSLTGTREPDFFELLQAGILNGSLGDASSSDPALPSVHQQSKMLHILTIGANLIAQSRADSYPVRIACNVAGTTMEAVGMPRLPCLSSLAACPVAGTGLTGGVNWLLVPNLWDPFRDSWDLTEQNAGNTGNKPLSTPGYLRPPVRITVRGGIGFGAATFSQSGSVDLGSVTAFPAQSTGINGSLTLTTGNSTFGRDGLREAIRLGVSDISDTLQLFDPTTSPGVSPVAEWRRVARPTNDSSTYRTDQFVVFRLSLPGNLILPLSILGQKPVIILQPGFQVSLDYQSPNGQWYSYSFLQGNNATNTWISGSNPSNPSLALGTSFSQYGINPGPPPSALPTIINSGPPLIGQASLWTVEALAKAPMFAKADPRSIRYDSQIGVINVASNSAGVIASIWPSQYGVPPSMSPSGYPIPTPTPNPNPATVGDNAPAGLSANPYNEFVPAGQTVSIGDNWRPVMMNRPFRSVGEIGYVFRDQPFRTLSFSSANSPDAGLLDLFSVNDYSDPSGMRGGAVSLNSRQAPALAGVITSTIRREDTPRSSGAAPSPSPSPLASPIANSVATSLTLSTIGTPLVNRAGLADLIAANPTGLDASVPKTQRESIARALGETGQTRTWNLLIDVIAQSGRYPPNATSLTNGFVVNGEQRYWVHVAIDRFTGQVIDKQIEVVNE
jgi:hypothetical protein